MRVGLPSATSNSNPSVSGYIGTNTTITAGNGVTVSATSASTPAHTFTDFIQSVNTSTDTINFPSHGLADGDQVRDVAGAAFGPVERIMFRMLGIRQFLLLQRAGRQVNAPADSG